MPGPFEFAHRIDFSPANSDALLRSIPAAPGVFSLRGEDPKSEPYITRAADLRRRLRRLLAPPEALNEDGTPILSKRLNLRERVHLIEYTRTGSDFESSLVLYCATRAAFGPEQARKRLRLHTPYFLRVTMQHAHPRVYATNKLSKKSLPESFGPFPSRAAAERYGDAVLDLFQLRRCHEDLVPHPDHPGCVYGEMKKCMAPCKAGSMQGCRHEESEAQYAAEAHRVQLFFATRGESLLNEVATQREAASQNMHFEQAAALHKHWEKIRAASLLADELVRPVADLRALVVQESVSAELVASGGPSSPTVLSSAKVGSHNPDTAALFLLTHGHIAGPEPLSTLGVRAVREQTAVGSSLFAQPLMLAAVPLNEPPNSVILSEGASHSEAPHSKDLPDISSPQTAQAISTSTLSPEDRARAAITALEARTQTPAGIHELFDIQVLCDYLSLFRRWYYRPEKQRQGEVFLPNPDGSWPIRRILNGAARVVLGPPAQLDAVNREAAREALKTVKTKIIHEGREGVEREVPVLPRRKRTRKSITPADVLD